MQKELLYEIKRSIATGTLALALTSLSGCGETTNEEVKLNIIENNSENEYKEMFKEHEHLILEINGLTYIFRECEPNIDISLVKSSYAGYFTYSIYDGDNTLILQGVTSYTNSHKFNIKSEEMEENANMIEEKLIENGAELYLAPTK